MYGRDLDGPRSDMWQIPDRAPVNNGPRFPESPRTQATSDRIFREAYEKAKRENRL